MRDGIDYKGGIQQLLKEELNLKLKPSSLLIEKHLLSEDNKKNKEDVVKDIEKELQKALLEKVRVDINFYPIDSDNENYIVFSGLMFNEIIFNYRYENGDVELTYSNKSPNIKTIELQGELAKTLEDFKQDFFNIINNKF